MILPGILLLVGTFLPGGALEVGEALLGVWRVDLRPTPSAEPYYQTLEITSVENNTLSGSFYDATIESGKIDTDWDGIHVSFVVRKGAFKYHTAAVLRGGRLEGSTHLVERGLLTPWRALPQYEPVRLSPTEAREDLGLLFKALRHIHPGLYRYTTEAEIEAGFRDLERGVSGGTTDLDLYRDISVALARIRCGHTRVEGPAGLYEYRERVPTHLPFHYRLIDGRMMVDAVDAAAAPSLKRGQELLSVNGVSVAKLIADVGLTVSLDGFTDHVRASRLDTAYEFNDSGLDHYLPLFYGFRDGFALQVADPGSSATFETWVRAVPAQRWRALVPGGPRSFADSVNLQLLDDGVVLLEIGSFINYRNTVDPLERMSAIFRAINAAGTRHLILDLRQNGGGSGDVAWTLARFLVEQPIVFKPPLVKNYRFDPELRAHLSTWAEGAMDMPPEAFDELPDGWYALRPEASGRTTRLEPHDERFHGRLTVLIGPYNASGTTMLLARLKEEGRALLIGQPTGGSAEGPTAGVIFTLKLPVSGISVNIPALWERGPVDTFESGRGVVPDRVVGMTVEDFLSGRDPVLEEAIKQTR